MRNFLLCLLLASAVTVTVGTCFEPLTLVNTELSNRYQVQSIRAITPAADDITAIQVLVNTPNCSQWVQRGCIYVKIQGKYRCWSALFPSPVLRGGCGFDSHHEVHAVYDSERELRTDARVRERLVSCSAVGRMLWLQFL